MLSATIVPPRVVLYYITRTRVLDPVWQDLHGRRCAGVGLMLTHADCRTLELLTCLQQARPGIPDDERVGHFPALNATTNATTFNEFDVEVEVSHMTMSTSRLHYHIPHASRWSTTCRA